jgi:predicted metal-dependent peptidase
MSQTRKTPVKIGGKNGVIVHDILCADGPVDPETGKPLINPETGKPYPGKNDDMAALLAKYLVKLRGTSMGGASNAHSVPRFGVLSLIAMSTPIFVYDHPRFKKFANTAFTDGHSIFIDADFMRKLVTQEKESEGKLHGVLFLLLHELMHKMYAHLDRMKDVPPIIANIAQDMVINGKIIKNFSMLKPVPLLAEVGWGMKPAEADKYHNMSEELLCEELLINHRKKKKKKQEEENPGEDQDTSNEAGDDNDNDENEDQDDNQQQSQKKDQDNQSGDGGGGDDQEQDEDDDYDLPDNADQGNQGQDDYDDDNVLDEDEDENENSNSNSNSGGKPGKGKGKGKPGKGKGGKGSSQGQGGAGDDEPDDMADDGEYSAIHTVDPREVIKAMEEEGLVSPKNALKLPDSNDQKGLEQKKKESHMNTMNAIQQAISEAKKVGGSYPGGHIADEAAMVYGNLVKGKLTYKMMLRKMFQGEGQKLYPSADEADIPWLLTKSTMKVDPWYQEALIPQAPNETVIGIIDTSGSTGRDGMREMFLSEALHLQDRLAGDCARKVILYSADTVVRGEPLVITKNNVAKLKHDGVQVFGNGGTEFSGPLKTILESPERKKDKVKYVFYYTDSEGACPKYEEFKQYIDMGIKIVFFTTPECYNQTWVEELESWAGYYKIEDNTNVDLTVGQNLSQNKKPALA